MKRSGKIPWTLAAAFLLLAAAVSVRAQSSLQAEIKAFFIGTQNASDSIQSYLGHRTQVDENLSLRVKWTWSKGPFDFTAHYLVAGRNGDTVALEPQLEHLFEAGGPAPAMPWWNLSRTIHAARQTEVTQRFDRFYAGYTGAHLVVRVGRQALTWGTGLVFHPMDLFNPFSPNAVDTEYKPGTDMLYGQWLFNSGSDLQGLVVPRRNSLTGRLEGGQASTAVKWHGAGARFQTDVMAAKHYGDKILGADVSGPAGGAAWSAGVVATRLQGGGTRVSWVANLRSAQTWAGKSTTLYVENFHNGFGTARSPYTFASLSEPLRERLLRGELFDTGRDYLAAGADVQWTPLVTLSPLLIANLNDRSLLAQVNMHVSLSDNVLLDMGLQAPVGGRGTEFGGLVLSPSEPWRYGPGKRLFIELRGYF